MAGVWILAGLTLVIALVGGLLPVLGNWQQNQKLLHKSTSIAAGVLLASALLVILPEGFEIAGESDHLLMGGMVLSGFMMMLILEGSGIGHAIHEEHHDHEGEHGHTHVHHQTAPLLLVLGLSLHAAVDGLAIGSAMASGSAAISAIITLAVILHKVPAAFSLGIFSTHQNTEKKDVIRDVVLFSLATPVFIILSFFMLQDIAHETIGLLMLFAGGTFLYVSTVDTLPDIHNTETGRSAMLHVVLGAGLLTLALIVADYSGILEMGH
jgi:zinc transporter 9